MKEEATAWDVFLSHNRRQKPWVRLLVNQWRSPGLRVFFDEDSLEPGELVPLGIERGVSHSRYIVLIITPSSMESRWVANEASMARYSDPDATNRRLIPVMLEVVERDRIPLNLRQLSTVDLTESATKVDQYHRLVKFLKPDIREPPDPPDTNWPTEAPVDRPMKLFDQQEAGKVFLEADRTKRERLERIQSLLIIMVESFKTIFLLDPNSLDIHPFFKDVKTRLEPLIPAINLDADTGILERAGIRHVILRTGTLVTILALLEDDELFKTGKTIGQNAAADLVESVLKRLGYVPCTSEAFVELWGYWDTTGGWGKLKLVTSDGSHNTSTEKQKVPKHKWTIEIRNNFLAVGGDLELTHRHCNFWRGYLHGFLEESLPRVEQMMRESDEKSYQQVALPAYDYVDHVEHVFDEHEDVDIFHITFQEHPLSPALEYLTTARWRLRQSLLRESMLLSSAAITSARDWVTKNEDALKTWDRVRQLYDETKLDELINQRLPRRPDDNKAKEWYYMSKEFVDTLAQARYLG